MRTAIRFEAILVSKGGLFFDFKPGIVLPKTRDLDPCMVTPSTERCHHVIKLKRPTETNMFTIIHTAYNDSESKIAVALRLVNPLSGVRYTFQLGLARDMPSNLDDVDAYARRVDDYRRSIDLSANP